MRVLWDLGRGKVALCSSINEGLPFNFPKCPRLALKHPERGSMWRPADAHSGAQIYCPNCHWVLSCTALLQAGQCLPV